MKKIQDADVKNKNVLVRIDADVPIENGEILDDTRVRASIPTIKYLLENDAKVTIIGHIGRPEGKEDPSLKMEPVENKIYELLGIKNNWQVLENLRFNKGEEENDPEFAKQLATGQDILIQDSFANCHREHASMVGVAKILPSYAGLAVINEVENLAKVLESPKEGFTIIIGGKKAEDKLPVIKNLFEKAETFLIGGVVANTFLLAKGYKLGKSVIETEVIDEANKIMEMFRGRQDKKLLLPADLLFSASIKEPANLQEQNIDHLNNLGNFYAVDIGQETVWNYIVDIKKSKTIFWNGNMGVSEVEEFGKGTMRIAEAIGNSQAKKYAGGGDTSSFIQKMGIGHNFDFISLAGGATLEFLAGNKLPGLEVLG